MAKKFWADGDPLGRRVRIGLQGQNTGPWLTIVGVVGDIRHRGLDADPNPEFYVPYEQAAVQGMVLVARTAGDPHALVEAVRAQLRAPRSRGTDLGAGDARRRGVASVAQPRSRTLVCGVCVARAVARGRRRTASSRAPCRG
jgi:hypothetical protein